jgi:hypothetical protein
VADDPELLAAQLRAEHEVQRPALPAASSDQPLPFPDAPGDGEDQPPGELRDRLGQHVWRVRHDDAPLLRRRNVDVLVAHGDVRDDLQAIAGCEDVFRNAVGQQADERILAHQSPLQLLRGHGGRAVVQVDQVRRGKHPEDRRRNAPGQKDGQ